MGFKWQSVSGLLTPLLSPIPKVFTTVSKEASSIGDLSKHFVVDFQTNVAPIPVSSWEGDKRIV